MSFSLTFNTIFLNDFTSTRVLTCCMLESSHKTSLFRNRALASSNEIQVECVYARTGSISLKEEISFFPLDENTSVSWKNYCTCKMEKHAHELLQLHLLANNFIAQLVHRPHRESNATFLRGCCSFLLVSCACPK